MPPVSGADSLQVRRAYLRNGRSRHGHDRRLIARWMVLAVVVLWLLVASVVLVGAGLAASSRDRWRWPPPPHLRMLAGRQGPLLRST